MHELVFVAGRETFKLIVAESKTHEVGAMRELVAGGGTHEDAVGE